MFYYLSGTVAHLAHQLAVIDCGGVGYACRTTAYTLSALQAGTDARLYTHFYLREDVAELYGFATQEELRCFQLLLGVSGVGPRAALSILSATTPQHLATAIITGDLSVLTAASGVGKKIAQRILLELKDKLIKEQDLDLGPTLAPPGAEAQLLPQNKAAEAAAALAVLGYNPTQVRSALAGLDLDALPLEEIIRQALRNTLKS